MTGGTMPVISLEQAGAARDTYAGEISSGCAGRFISLALPNPATCPAGAPAGFGGVHTGPGAAARPH